MIISICILIFLAFGFLLGFKRGFTYQLVRMLGVILIFILATIFKHKLGMVLFSNFPLFNFGEGLNSINILVYESIAFILIFFILSIILRLLLIITKNFEKVLKATIILGIPSKILGGVLALLEYYIYIFIVLIIINLPVFHINLNNSRVANFILNKTPVISDKFNVNIINDINDIINNEEKSEKMSDDIIDILVNNKIISKENALKYKESGKF